MKMRLARWQSFHSKHSAGSSWWLLRFTFTASTTTRPVAIAKSVYDTSGTRGSLSYFSRSVLWALTGPRGLVIVSQMMSAVLLITFPRIELRMYEYLQHGRVAINSLPRHAASLVWHGPAHAFVGLYGRIYGMAGSNCFNNGFVMHVKLHYAK